MPIKVTKINHTRRKYIKYDENILIHAIMLINTKLMKMKKSDASNDNFSPFAGMLSNFFTMANRALRFNYARTK